MDRRPARFIFKIMSSRFGNQDLLACYPRGLLPDGGFARCIRTCSSSIPTYAHTPLDAFHIPRRLSARDPGPLPVWTADTAFHAPVMDFVREGAGREAPGSILQSSSVTADLHARGHAHIHRMLGRRPARRRAVPASLLAGPFSARACISPAPPTVKEALFILAARLIAAALHAARRRQFHKTRILEQFGLIEIPRAEFSRPACADR